MSRFALRSPQLPGVRPPNPPPPPPSLRTLRLLQEHTPPLVIELHPTWWRVRTTSTEKQGQGHKKTANLQYCYASRQVRECGGSSPAVGKRVYLTVPYQKKKKSGKSGNEKKMRGKKTWKILNMEIQSAWIITRPLVVLRETTWKIAWLC